LRSFSAIPLRDRRFAAAVVSTSAAVVSTPAAIAAVNVPKFAFNSVSSVSFWSICLWENWC